jgi:hypothetical protein
MFPREVTSKLEVSEMAKSNTTAQSDERRILAAISSDDGQQKGVCDGPDDNGICPWQAPDGQLPCTGGWLTSMGWTFKVADDAKGTCPLYVLGIAGRRGGYSGRFGV